MLILCHLMIMKSLIGLGSRMHGRDWEGAAPEFDMVDRASVPRLRFFFFFFS